MGKRYWVVLFRKYMVGKYFYALNLVPWGMSNSAGVSMAVLDTETWTCEWRPYVDMKNLMDYGGIMRSGRLALPWLSNYSWGTVAFFSSVTARSKQQYVVKLAGHAYSFSCNSEAFYFNGEFLFLLSRMALSAKMFFCMVCQSAVDVFRVVFMMGDVPRFLNFWLDVASGKVLCYGCGFDIIEKLYMLDSLPESCNSKVESLKVRLTKSALLGNRLY